ncbi:hypothetical protein [Paenibacillus humicus]|uniref:hypothetical protein n=1 Tax=Paenibacillus humicus TaxID=412861 RepID=UPI003D2BF9FB
MKEISTSVIKGFEEHFKLFSCSSKQYDVYKLSKDINEEWNVTDGFDVGLVRYDYINNKTEFYPFQEPAHIVPRNFSYNYFYYGSLNWDGNVVKVSVYQINCSRRIITTNKVYSFEIKDSTQDDIELSKLWGIELYSLSERYICLAIPYTDQSRELSSRFSHFILIDILEKRSYVFPESLGEKDSILRLDSLYVFESSNKSYIILTTGRILTNEKEKLWKNSKKDLNQMLQNVFFIELDEFVNLVKSGSPISSSYVIDTSFFDRGIVNISYSDTHIILHKHIFPKKTSEFVQYNFKTKQRKNIILKHLYNIIFNKNKEVLGYYINNENKTNLCNLDTETLEIALNEKETLVYVSDNREYLVSNFNNNRLTVEIIGHNNFKEIFDISITSDRYSLHYNERYNRIVLIL